MNARLYSLNATFAWKTPWERPDGSSLNGPRPEAYPAPR